MRSFGNESGDDIGDGAGEQAMRIACGVPAANWRRRRDGSRGRAGSCTRFLARWLRFSKRREVLHGVAPRCTTLHHVARRCTELPVFPVGRTLLSDMCRSRVRRIGLRRMSDRRARPALCDAVGSFCAGAKSVAWRQLASTGVNLCQPRAASRDALNCPLSRGTPWERVRVRVAVESRW